MTSERRGWRDHPLVQLTLVRYREFFREPEAVFWVFVFPVLLTAGLGMAFRNQAPERTPVAVVEGEGARRVQETLAHSADVRAEVLSDTAAAQALRTGRVEIVVVPGAGGAVEYRFDPDRPESRTARLLVDDALQRGSGRGDPIAVKDDRVSEPGSRYVDFVVPGLLGMNLMGSGIWGLGFSIVDARRKKLAQAPDRHADVADPVPGLVRPVAADDADHRGRGLWWASRVLVFGVPAARLAAVAARHLPALGARVRRAGPAAGLPRPDDRGRLGAHEPGDAARCGSSPGCSSPPPAFPTPLQPFIQALPLTAVNDALRASMLEGAGLARLGPELAIIVAWLVVSFLLAVRLFRWR